jgi:hypothetical protein
MSDTKDGWTRLAVSVHRGYHRRNHRSPGLEKRPRSASCPAVKVEGERGGGVVLPVLSTSAAGIYSIFIQPYFTTEILHGEPGQSSVVHLPSRGALHVRVHTTDAVGNDALGKAGKNGWDALVGDSQKTPDIRVGYSRVEANGKEGMGGGGRGVTGGGGGLQRRWVGKKWGIKSITATLSS